MSAGNGHAAPSFDARDPRQVHAAIVALQVAQQGTAERDVSIFEALGELTAEVSSCSGRVHSLESAVNAIGRKLGVVEQIAETTARTKALDADEAHRIAEHAARGEADRVRLEFARESLADVKADMREHAREGREEVRHERRWWREKGFVVALACATSGAGLIGYLAQQWLALKGH